MRTALSKIATLVLVVAAIGLPINRPLPYGGLLVAAVLIFAGTISLSWRRWLLAVVAVAVVYAVALVAPQPQIEEGHNVFIVDPGRGTGALQAGLPAGAFAAMAAQFHAAYPPDRHCDPKAQGCWRGSGFPDRAYAFSADGIFQHPAYSRRVTAIAFDDPAWARLGFVNDWKYNWYKNTDVKRGTVTIRGWAPRVHWQAAMPYFTMFRFPADFAGSALCWRGTVLWENANSEFTSTEHAQIECRTLAAADAGRQIFVLSIKADPPLAVELKQNTRVRLLGWLAGAMMVLGVVAILFCWCA